MYGEYVGGCLICDVIPVIYLYRLSSGPESPRRQHKPVVLVTGISQSVAKTLKEVSLCFMISFVVLLYT